MAHQHHDGEERRRRYGPRRHWLYYIKKGYRGRRLLMSKERLYLFDTTLRDGAQMNGVDFTLHDKLTIAKLLDELGIDYIEGGYPGANPTDTELFGEERKLGATFTAFGMTRRPGRSTSNDPGLATLLDAKADAICFVAKSWDYHVRVALETTERGKPRLDPRQRDGRQAKRPRGPDRLRAFLRRLQGQSATTRSPAPRRRTRPARAGSCCATPMAARCRTRSRRSSATW